MIILLDNGHGSNTPGKQSPDGFFREYAYNRFLASEIHERLTALGIDSRFLVPEREDIPLPERCRRANTFCEHFGSDQVILLSIHVNAAGNGQQWMKARGSSCYTARGETKADALATCCLPVTLKRPFMYLACDIKYDMETRKHPYKTDKEFLAYVKTRLPGSDQMYALKTFKHNYRAWLRRQKGK